MRNARQILLAEILLDEAGVDRISAVLQEWMAGEKVQPKNALRCRLAAEGLLEKLCFRFDRQLRVSAEVRRRFGSRAFTVRYPGEPYNPIGQKETDGWTDRLLSSVGLTPEWNYRQGANELTLKLPRNKLRSEIVLLAAFFAAVALGLAQPVLPSLPATVLGRYVFPSVSAVFTGLLGAFAGIMVFLTVISGVCGVGNVADFSKLGKYLIGRNVLFSFLGGGLCAALLLPLFSFRYGVAGGESQLSAVLDMLLAIVPKDPVTPFLTGNTLQIVVMALFIGLVTVLLGSKTKGLREAFLQANAVAARLIEIVCRLLPLYILSSLTLLFWENGMGIFRTVWKPVALCAAACALLMAIKTLTVSLRCGVSPLRLMKKTLPCFLIALTTASSMAAFGTVMEENEKELGVNPQLTNFGYPVEMILCVSTVSGGFLAIIYYLAEYYHIEVSAVWFITAWIMITILSFSMPPVAGGTLVCLSVLLAQSGIPAASLGLAGMLALTADFFMTGSRVVISQMELVLEAKHWNTLDLEKLRR